MRYIRSLLPVFIITFIFLSIGNSLLVVTDPVESNYALTAKEMVLAGDWLSPRIYNTFWYDKPVFTYWSLCLSYTLFGYSDFATRLPFAVSGALSVTVLTYYVKRRGNSPAMANLLAAMTATSLLFWILSHSVLTDQWLLLFTETALFSLYIGITENARSHTRIAYGAAALAVLTKGPVGIVLPGLIILLYIAAERKSVYLRRVFRPEGILIFLLLCMPWFIYMYTMHGREFLDGLLGFNNITRATVSEHPEENVFYYYLLLVPAALLPWTGACFYGITHFFRKSGFPLFLTLWAGVTILFYTLMATKYPTYAYIAHIPLLYFGMLGLALIYDREKNKTWFILTGPALFFWLLIWLAALIVRVDYICSRQHVAASSFHSIGRVLHRRGPKTESLHGTADSGFLRHGNTLHSSYMAGTRPFLYVQICRAPCGKGCCLKRQDIFFRRIPHFLCLLYGQRGRLHCSCRLRRKYTPATRCRMDTKTSLCR